MDTAKIEERLAPPLTVKLYLAVYLLAAVISAFVDGLDQLVIGLIGTAIGFLLFILPIWRGSRIGWFIIVVLGFVALVSMFMPQVGAVRDARGEGDAFMVAWALTDLALLVHPQTQRWCKVRL